MARAYIQTGHIQGDDLIWSEDQNLWIPAHDHPLLKGFQPPPPLKPSFAAPTHRSVGGWLLFLCILLTIVNPLSTIGYLAYIWSFDSPQTTVPAKTNYRFKDIWDKYQELQTTRPDLIQGMTLHDYSQYLNEHTKSHMFDAGLYPNTGKYVGAEVDGTLNAIGITTTAGPYYTEPILCSLFLVASSIWFFTTGLNLWKRKPNAVKRAKYFLVFMGVFPILTIVIIRIDSMPDQIRDYLTNGMAYQIIPQIFWSTVWYIYLVHSKRVRETFQSPAPAA